MITLEAIFPCGGGVLFVGLISVVHIELMQ